MTAYIPRLRHALVAVALAASTFHATPASAQQDLQLWASAGVRGDVADDLRLSFRQYLRFERDASRVRSVMPQVALTYRINKRWRLAGGYRLQYMRDNVGQFQSRHRLFFDGRYRITPGRFSLAVRVRFQEQIRDSSDSGDQFRHVIRGAVTGGWRLQREVQPYVSTELFVRMANGGTFIEAKKLRFTLGVDLAPSKAHEFEVYYRLSIPVDGSNDPTLHIIGLGYGLDL